MATALADFIGAAWNDHAADPAGVARRLADARPLLENEPEQLAAFVQLAEHVLVAHLGDGDAIERSVAAWAPLAASDPDAQDAIERARLAGALLRGEGFAAEGLAAPLVVRAHGSAAAGAAARGDLTCAESLLRAGEAVARAANDAEAIKALAAGYNNLATQLLEAPRDAASDALMLECARRARDAWSEVGTWLNAERADWLLARCAAAAGAADEALRHARSCLAICEANQADAFERFFAHQALAEALRAAGEGEAAVASVATMRELLPAIDDADSRAYAERVLAEWRDAPAR